MILPFWRWSCLPRGSSTFLYGDPLARSLTMPGWNVRALPRPEIAFSRPELLPKGPWTLLFHFHQQYKPFQHCYLTVLAWSIVIWKSSVKGRHRGPSLWDTLLTKYLMVCEDGPWYSMYWTTLVCQMYRVRYMENKVCWNTDADLMKLPGEEANPVEVARTTLICLLTVTRWMVFEAKIT